MGQTFTTCINNEFSCWLLACFMLCSTSNCAGLYIITKFSVYPHVADKEEEKWSFMSYRMRKNIFQFSNFPSSLVIARWLYKTSTEIQQIYRQHYNWHLYLFRFINLSNLQTAGANRAVGTLNRLKKKIRIHFVKSKINGRSQFITIKAWETN